MKNRHPLAVFILPYITFGLYSIVWLVSTKKELNELVGTSIPTTCSIRIFLCRLGVHEFCQLVRCLG